MPVLKFQFNTVKFHCTDLEHTHNYFDDLTKLFWDLYLAKFLDTLVKLFFSLIFVDLFMVLFSIVSFASYGKIKHKHFERLFRDKIVMIARWFEVFSYLCTAGGSDYYDHTNNKISSEKRLQSYSSPRTHGTKRMIARRERNRSLRYYFRQLSN